MSLLAIPPEILLEIIAHIDGCACKAAMASTNRYLRRLTEPALYSHLLGEIESPLFILRTIVGHLELATHIRSLTVHTTGRPANFASVFTDKEARQLAQVVRSLLLPFESAFLFSLQQGNPGTAWAAILALSLNLEWLYLEGHVYTRPIEFKYIGRFLGLAQELTCSPARSRFDNLRTVEIRQLNTHDGGALASNFYRVFNCPSLRTVKLCHCNFQNEGELEWMFDVSSSNVTDLAIIQTICKPGDLQHIVHACKALKSFYYQILSVDMTFVEDEASKCPTSIVSVLEKHQATLVDLRLQILLDCELDENIPRITSLRQFSQLQHLDVNVGILSQPAGLWNPGGVSLLSVFPSSLESLSLCHDRATDRDCRIHDLLGDNILIMPQLRVINVYPPWLLDDDDDDDDYIRLWDKYQQEELKALERHLNHYSVQFHGVTKGSEWYIGFFDDIEEA